MSYRKITVGGKEYQYTIGRTHLKVRGFPVVENSMVGQLVEKIRVCECGCGLPLNELYDIVNPIHLQVYPADVKRYITKCLNE